MLFRSMLSELKILRKLLYRAVRELDYIHECDVSDGNMITTSEGKSIVTQSMEILGCSDLSEEELPMRLVNL